MFRKEKNNLINKADNNELLLSEYRKLLESQTNNIFGDDKKNNNINETFKKLSQINEKIDSLKNSKYSSEELNKICSQIQSEFNNIQYFNVTEFENKLKDIQLKREEGIKEINNMKNEFDKFIIDIKEKKIDLNSAHNKFIYLQNRYNILIISDNEIETKISDINKMFDESKIYIEKIDKEIQENEGNKYLKDMEVVIGKIDQFFTQINYFEKETLRKKIELFKEPFKNSNDIYNYFKSLESEITNKQINVEDAKYKFDTEYNKIYIENTMTEIRKITNEIASLLTDYQMKIKNINELFDNIDSKNNIIDLDFIDKKIHSIISEMKCFNISEILARESDFSNKLKTYNNLYAEGKNLISDLNTKIIKKKRETKDINEKISRIREISLELPFNERKEFIDALSGIEKNIVREESKDFVEKNISEIEKMFKEVKVNFTGNKSYDIRISAKIELFKECDMSEYENFIIFSGKKLYSKAFIINNNDEICAMVELKNKNDKEYYITCKAEYIYDKFGNNNQHYLVLFTPEEGGFLDNIKTNNIEIPNTVNCIKISINLEVKEKQLYNTTLCIDFGTSNTSAGCFFRDLDNNNNSIRYTLFEDDKGELKKIIPTIVYVKDCSKDKPEFLFGWKAKQTIESDFDYCPDASVFYEIKRWFNSIDDEQEIIDEYNNKKIISKSLIIKEYLNYVIKQSEKQFKGKFEKIHLSSPVKLKAGFEKMFESIFNKNEITLSNETLDEAITVIYNDVSAAISELINKADDEQRQINWKEEIKALIIDCGGGTTDLASCTFKIDKDEEFKSIVVDIDTEFENGAVNFGGNNITYRIMQYIKIKLADKLNGKHIRNIGELITHDIEDIFSKVSELGKEEIYNVFDEEYKKAEQIIPTKYKHYIKKDITQYTHVINNFYFLWEIAETLKKEFYKENNTFISEITNKKEINADINAIQIEKWHIHYINKNNEFTVLDPTIINESVKFDIKEIEKLIKGDIYEVIDKFLVPYADKIDYDIVRLTGQSCRINIFKESLKEFIPGRKIKSSLSKDNNTIEMKLKCLNGAINYFNDKKEGREIKIKRDNYNPKIPYDIFYKFGITQEFLFNLEKKETIDYKNACKLIGCPVTLENFYYQITENKKLNTINDDFMFKIDHNNFETASLDKIMIYLKDFSNPLKEEIENKINNHNFNNKMYICAFVNIEKWGISFLPIKRIDDQLHIYKNIECYPFEKDIISFFEGDK